MPKFKKPALEVILTTLHAGGKFEQGNYIHSGGLHGVGSSVVNALSSELVAQVKRDGKRYEQTFARGKADVASSRSSAPARGTGTTITFEPGPGDLRREAEVRRRADPRAARGQELPAQGHDGRLHATRPQSPATEETFKHDGGIAEYLAKVVAERGKPLVPPQARAASTSRATTGVRLELALQWTEAHRRARSARTSTASRPPHGGTHEAGLRGGVVKAVRNYIETHELDAQGRDAHRRGHPRGHGRDPVDLRASSRSSRARPRTGSTTPRSQAQVDGVVRPALEKWLNDNQTVAEAVVARIILAARAREASRAASQAVIAQDGGSATG